MARAYAPDELRYEASRPCVSVAVAEMLRQAADMMGRANNVIKSNAKSIKYRHRDADAVLETAEYILTGRRC